MRDAARLFLVLMSATFALTVVLEGATWVSASAQEHVDRPISTLGKIGSPITETIPDAASAG